MLAAAWSGRVSVPSGKQLVSTDPGSQEHSDLRSSGLTAGFGRNHLVRRQTLGCKMFFALCFIIGKTLKQEK